MTDFDTWLKTGIDAGFVGPPVCAIHDGLPSSADEDARFDDGEDPCLHVLRCYPDPDTKIAVEDNHPPSVWRRTNRYGSGPL